MLLRNQSTPIELLITRRDIKRGIPIKEIDRLQLHLDNLTRHDWEIFHARHMLQSELQPHDYILVHDGLLAVRPGAHPGPAAGLVRVFAAGVELAVVVSGDVDVVVCELGAFVVEGVDVGEHFLEGRGVDSVADCFAVDGVAGGCVEDFEGAAGVGVGVEAGGFFDCGFRDGVADAVGVEVGGDGDGVGFVVDEAVGVAVDGGVDAQGEDVLVVDGEDAGVDDGAPWYFDALVDGLGADDAGGSDLVGHLAGLVEHEGHDVFVVGDCDDGLDNQLPASYNGCSAGSVVGVLPANAGVLLMNTDYVFHGHWLSVAG